MLTFICHTEYDNIDREDTMKRVLVCGLFGILFTGTAINGLDKITSVFQKLKDSKVGRAVNQFTQTQTFQTIKQVAMTVILPKIKEKISNMKTAVTSKNAEAINGLNNAQAGLVSNANILSQSGNTAVVNAVNSANASAGQIIAQLRSLQNNLGISTVSNASQISAQSTKIKINININNIQSFISSFIASIRPFLENIRAQQAILQSNLGALNPTQQMALNSYTTQIAQITNLAQASSYASGISAYIDQIIGQAQASNITKDNLKLWVSELAAYGSAFQQSLNAGGISLDAKTAALITGSDLLTTLTENGVDVNEANVSTAPINEQITMQTRSVGIQPQLATQQPVVQPVAQPVVQQSQSVQQTATVKRTTVSRRRR